MKAAPDRLSMMVSVCQFMGTVSFAYIGVISLFADRVAHLPKFRSEILRRIERRQASIGLTQKSSTPQPPSRFSFARTIAGDRSRAHCLEAGYHLSFVRHWDEKLLRR